MSVTWTSDQILKLAPDDSSAKSGRGLAGPKNWVTLGIKDKALWGECQGSGSKPYQVQVDLTEPAFKCSCPSRKFPCKHGIGLMLLYAEQPGQIAEADPPAWVADWLKGRQEKVEKKAAKESEEKSPEELAKLEAQAVKRAAAREKKVGQGVQDLDLWFRDLVRQGFSTASVRDYKFWDGVAARMVDAGAGSVGRRLRKIPEIANSAPDWQEQVLERVGREYLLVEGFQRIDSLPEATQNDIRSSLGISLDKKEVLANPNSLRVEDVWVTLGQRTDTDAAEKLQTRRCWLLGVNTGRFALLVSYAPTNQSGNPITPMEVCPPVGSVFAATLTYYPGGAGLRVVFPDSFEANPVSLPPSGFPGMDALLSAYADALGANPWLETFPAYLKNVSPVRTGDGWLLRDEDGKALPVVPNWGKEWTLMALAGGTPLPLVFAEWTGRYLTPVTAVTTDGRTITLA